MKRNEDRGRAERNSALPLFLLRRGLYKYHTRKGIAMRVQGKREVIKLLTDVTYSRVEYWYEGYENGHFNAKGVERT